MPFTLIFSVVAFTLLYGTSSGALPSCELEEGREERELQLAIERARPRRRDQTTVPA